MDPPERAEAPLVCADADVLVAGLFSTKGASHALLVLGEIGIVRVAVPAAAVEEVRRNCRQRCLCSSDSSRARQ